MWVVGFWRDWHVAPRSTSKGPQFLDVGVETLCMKSLLTACFDSPLPLRWNALCDKPSRKLWRCECHLGPGYGVVC